jgi:hypothetical protein
MQEPYSPQTSREKGLGYPLYILIPWKTASENKERTIIAQPIYFHSGIFSAFKLPEAIGGCGQVCTTPRRPLQDVNSLIMLILEVHSLHYQLVNFIYVCGVKSKQILHHWGGYLGTS